MVMKINPGLKGYGLLKNLTLPAYFHFLLPTLLNLPMADCAANAPAKLSGLKFPGRTIFPGFFPALQQHPARLDFLMSILFQCEKKQKLTFYMHGNVPPPLFETLDGLDGDPQQLGYPKL